MQPFFFFCSTSSYNWYVKMGEKLVWDPLPSEKWLTVMDDGNHIGWRKTTKTTKKILLWTEKQGKVKRENCESISFPSICCTCLCKWKRHIASVRRKLAGRKWKGQCILVDTWSGQTFLYWYCRAEKVAGLTQICLSQRKRSSIWPGCLPNYLFKIPWLFWLFQLNSLTTT